MTVETLLSICLGIGLSASVGFRVFVPLFALSLASYFNFWELNASWQWIGSSSAVILLGIATIVEICAYFIPLIDNLLDTIAIPLATLAGIIVMVSLVSDLSPVITWALAIIAGGGTAATIAGSSSATRLASTTSTGGLANPVLASIETVSSIVMSIVSLVFPFAAIVLVIILIWIVFRLNMKFRKSKS